MCLSKSDRSVGGNSHDPPDHVLAACSAVQFGVSVSDARAEEAYGRQWGHSYNAQDWERMYHYPYVYYPQNFWGHDYYRSSEDMYYRYPPEMRIPVYHKQWENYYPNTGKTRR